MGSGYGANFADTILERDLRLIGKCGVLLDQLVKALKCANLPNATKLLLKIKSKEDESLDEDDGSLDGEFSLEDFARAVQYQDTDEFKKVLPIFKKLQTEFKKETKLGLELGYHEAEEGSRYDDVEGVFWSVTGLYEETKAFKAFKKKYKIQIPRSFFVTYG